MAALTVSVSRVRPSGAWHVAAMIDGVRVARTYYGYTKRDAVAQFRAEHARG